MAAEALSRSQGGRVIPDPDRMASLNEERELIEIQLLLLVGAHIRRLWQRAESLPYVNDRPYTLALYLLFGSDIFGPICRNVEFDVEYVSFGDFTTETVAEVPGETGWETAAAPRAMEAAAGVRGART